MKKNDLKDILDIVKSKLTSDAEAACGLFWADDAPPAPEYAVGDDDNDPILRYAIGDDCD